MSTEEKTNRSSALSPEQVAEGNTAMTNAINSAVAAAVAAALAGIGPIIKDLALTPEKMREFNKPYVDPAKKARTDREAAMWREDIETNRKQIQDNQDHCPHEYENNKTSINLDQNFPDRQPRGLCVQCHALIYPREWRIGPPDAENPRGKPYLFGPHKDYNKVMQIVRRGGR